VATATETEGPRRITPVLLCGGSGTRLWPLSRRATPKQFLCLTGDETMLQQTAGRVRDEALFRRPLVIGAATQADEIAKQLAEAAVVPFRLILEPCARNTAPAVALAALASAADDLLLVMPSDSLIADADAFRAGVALASGWAEQGGLVTFGVRPDRAETGYGYVKRGAEIAPGLFEVDRFVEKPDQARAESFLRDGGYDWNAGIFLFRADVLLGVLRTFAPDIYAAAAAAHAAARADGDRLLPDADAFARAPPLSLDYAVMEKAERIAVVPLDMGWSDVGSWQALYEALSKDGDDNAVSGDVLPIDCQACLLKSDGPLVTAIGLKDLVVVATRDAVLIVSREDSQRVREAVERLAGRGDGTV
jgi:mannose-1-phosphate guanylyltransferase